MGDSPAHKPLLSAPSSYNCDESTASSLSKILDLPKSIATREKKRKQAVNAKANCITDGEGLEDLKQQKEAKEKSRQQLGKEKRKQERERKKKEKQEEKERRKQAHEKKKKIDKRDKPDHIAEKHVLYSVCSGTTAVFLRAKHWIYRQWRRE